VDIDMLGTQIFYLEGFVTCELLLKIGKDASSTGGVHCILIRYSILYTSVSHKVKEEFEDTKGVNRRRRDNNMARRKRTKGQTTIRCFAWLSIKCHVLT
jgi:hypothetical protein